MRKRVERKRASRGLLLRPVDSGGLKGDNMIVTIHQPEHMPWLGFFDKVMQADTFVILDNVQFERNYFQNRNKIRMQNGWSWVTVPIAKARHDILINEVKIAPEKKGGRKNWNLINSAYRKAPYFEKYIEDTGKIYLSDWERLCDFNIALINYFLRVLGIDKRIVTASKLGIQLGKGGTEVNLNICKEMNADIYLSGISGRDYLNEERFNKEGIKVIYQEFYHPIYKQLYEPFIPCMSIIDLLFNHGDKSFGVLKGIGVERMDTLFK